MAQAIRSHRRGRAAMDALLSRTFEIGVQPEQYKNNVIVVTAQSRKATHLFLTKAK